MSSNRHLAAIMITDIADSTATAHRDEQAALGRQVEQERILRPIFAKHGGREVKSMGDGFLVEFDSALAAIECAVDAQVAFRNRNSDRSVEPLLARIGIHIGDVEERNGDIFGDAVNIAARIGPNADPGGVCLSEPVYVQVRNKVPYLLVSIGSRTLKGIREAIELYRVTLPAAPPAPGPTARRAPRIAILPLVNISPDRENEYFADGLTEELNTVMSQVRGLRVISRTSVAQYKGTTKPITQIGAELGADSVLEGSVRKVGNQLRIAVQLVDTRSDEHRWAQTYDRRLENVFSIQADVAERVVAALKVELLASERTAIRGRPTDNLEAYEAYLRGIEATIQFRATGGPDEDLQAERYFEDAIRHDSKFAAAYSRLAGHLIRMMGDLRPTSEVAPRIRKLVAKALELSPESSDSYTARGALLMQVDHDWAEAEADFQRAIALNPSNTDARQHYVLLLTALQRFDEARVQNDLALEENPLDFMARSSLVFNAAHLGDLGAAVIAAGKLVGDYPTSLGAHALLASLYALLGRKDEALQAAQPLATRQDALFRFDYALVLAFLGNFGPARTLIAESEAGQLAPALPRRFAAQLHATMGNRDRALTLLEEDAKEGDNALWASYLYPPFDGIREDPRFQVLLQALKLPTELKRAAQFTPPTLER